MTLSRFHEAQAGVWETALAELRAGRKRTHWMWFIFPQLRGLGRSETARFYGLDGLAEARLYLADPVLRDRLELSAYALLEQNEDDPVAVMGAVDAMKLRSSATLFARAGAGAGDGAGDWAEAVLDRFFGGKGDEVTERMLE